jgi:hypothetical protein
VAARVIDGCCSTHRRGGEHGGDGERPRHGRRPCFFSRSYR